FSVSELRARLDNRLDLLTGGGRDRPDRQRTLRNTIEWSQELLDADERTMFQVFAAFSGGRLTDIEATLHEVPAVRDFDVVDTLSSLVDKNLVRVTPGIDRRPRFSMLHTIRDYAAEQLASTRELSSAVVHAHATHYAA